MGQITARGLGIESDNMIGKPAPDNADIDFRNLLDPFRYGIAQRFAQPGTGFQLWDSIAKYESSAHRLPYTT
jgi:hypothetical protein